VTRRDRSEERQRRIRVRRGRVGREGRGRRHRLRERARRRRRRRRSRRRRFARDALARDLDATVITRAPRQHGTQRDQREDRGECRSEEDPVTRRETSAP